MRFQAASPDARAVVYAGIQADPLVRRVAGLLAEATRGQLVLARAVMNGERTDPATWRRMFPGLFREQLTERSEAILAACLDVAERGEQARSQYRGAIVEQLTEVLLARRSDAVRRERRVLFDGVPAEIHPYDVTIEQPGQGEVYDCKWGARGINADVLHQLDDARRHAEAEGERLLVALVIFDSRKSCEVRVGRLTAPAGGTKLYAIESLQRLAGARTPPAWRPHHHDMPEDRFQATIPYRVRFDESTPAGILRVSALLRYAQDAAWIHSERLGFDRDWYAARGLRWLVRCAEVQLFGDVPMGETLAVTTQVIGYRKVWARRRTDVVRPNGQLASRVLTDWVITDSRGMPTRVPAEFGVFGTALATFTPGRVTLPATPGDAAVQHVQVRHQDLDPMGHVNNAAYLDYLEEAAADSEPGQVLLAGLPRRYRLEYLQPATPRAHLAGASWAFESGLAFRLTDGAGTELLRATVSPGGEADTDLDSA